MEVVICGEATTRSSTNKLNNFQFKSNDFRKQQPLGGAQEESYFHVHERRANFHKTEKQHRKISFHKYHDLSGFFFHLLRSSSSE